MAYEVTATRRRPQRFDDLVGQEFVAATLKNCHWTITKNLYGKAINDPAYNIVA